MFKSLFILPATSLPTALLRLGCPNSTPIPLAGHTGGIRMASGRRGSKVAEFFKNSLTDKAENLFYRKK